MTFTNNDIILDNKLHFVLFYHKNEAISNIAMKVIDKIKEKHSNRIDITKANTNDYIELVQK